MTMGSLVDKDAGPNIISKDFLLPASKEFIKPIKLSQPQMANSEVVNIERTVPLLICKGDLLLSAGIGIFENFVVHVLLGTSFIDRSIHRIFPTEHKSVLWHSKSMPIISTKMAINSINEDNTVFLVNNYSQNDASADEFNLCCVAREVTLPAYM